MTQTLSIIVFSGLVLLVLALIPIFFPESKIFIRMKDFYFNRFRPQLTKGKWSRASYTFAHGFFVCLVFFMTFAAAFLLIKDERTEIANKYIHISVSSDNGKLNSFDLAFNPSWTSTDTSYEPQQRGFSMLFMVNDSNNQPVEFKVSTKSNFNASFRTEAIEALSKTREISSTKEMSSIVKFENLSREQRDTAFTAFYITSEAPILDDDDYSNVNLYISFDQSLEELLPDSLCNSQMLIWLNSKRYDTLQTNMPYDLVAIKPESETNNPFKIEYTSSEKLKEVLKKGIYISTVNRDLKAKNDRIDFVKSVLAGTAASFLLTALIMLLTKWRNLNQRVGRKDPYD